MAEVVMTNVEKVYADGTQAVSDLNLRIDDGHLLVIVGPAGCGKTTALRMVTGLEEITSGTIHIGERVVNKLDPGERDVAMVFQNYALYPHMTVYGNIAFPLRLARVPEAERDARCATRRGCSGSRATCSESRHSSPGGSASGWPWDGRSSVSRACS